jgi:5-methylcytosine-specific restriction endonuclease McrA
MTRLNDVEVPESANRWLARKLNPNFRLVTFSQLQEETRDTPAFWVDDVDGAYRQGFESGFNYCIERFESMYREKGFSRVREIANMLWHWSGKVLTPWRYKGRGFLRNDYRPHPLHVQEQTWQEIRTRILRRDRACVRCGDIVHLEVDHIVEVQHGGVPTDDNLRVLCRVCHKGKSIWSGADCGDGQTVVLKGKQ